MSLQIKGLKEAQWDLRRIERRIQTVKREIGRNDLQVSCDTLSEEEIDRIVTPVIADAIQKQADLYIAGKTNRFSLVDIAKQAVAQLDMPIEIETA